MKLDMRRLAAIGALAVIYLVLGLLGSSIQAATGVPGASGFIMSFFSAMMFVLCKSLIPRFGSGFLMGLFYSVLALPLPTMGTPGFLPKLAIGSLAGLSADVVYALLRRPEWLRVALAGIVTQSVMVAMVLGLGLLFGLPGLDKLLKYAVPVISVMLLLGLAGGFVGLLIFKRIAGSAVVRRLGSE